MREYRIFSSKGAWPEVWRLGAHPSLDDYEIRLMAADLAYNRHHYPDVEFVVQVREVGEWEPSGLNPEVPFETRHDPEAIEQWLEDSEKDS